VAKAWEEAFFSMPAALTRKIAIRNPMTFRRAWYGTGWEALKGAAFVSWIHETDFCRAVDFLIEWEELSGVVTVASPNPLPNRQFLKILCEAWGIPFGLATPGWMLEIGTFLMRTESELVLKSRRVVPGRRLAGGFPFCFPEMAGGGEGPGGGMAETCEAQAGAPR
jgi:NAD dependent epimerase/dehydratase family enzyme